MITLEEIRKRLTEDIKGNKITQAQLAKKLGVTQQTVSLYLNGKATPALDTFANLCVILDIDANNILGIK